MKIIKVHDWIHDLDTNDKRKVHALIVEIGYHCRSCTDCPHHDCKYSKRKFIKIHNIRVSINDFFKYKLKINIPSIPICIEQHYVDLSGTTKCPYNMTRNYTCYDCKWICGDLLRDCSNLKYREDSSKGISTRDLTDKSGFSTYRECKYFESNGYCKEYNHNTGETIC